MSPMFSIIIDGFHYKELGMVLVELQSGQYDVSIENDTYKLHFNGCDRTKKITLYLFELSGSIYRTLGMIRLF